MYASHHTPSETDLAEAGPSMRYTDEADDFMQVTDVEIHVDETEVVGVRTESKATQAIIKNESCDQSSQVNMKMNQLMQQSIGTQTDESLIFCEVSTQTDNYPEVATYCTSESDGEDIFSSQETLYPSESVLSLTPQKEYLMPKSSEISSSETDDPETVDERKNVKPQDDNKFLVFESELFQLLKWCPVCGAAIVEQEKSSQGTLLFVALTCINNHHSTWQSQPLLNRMAAGNLLLSSAILLSGATYTKIAAFADILKMQFFSEKTFCAIQDEYLFPVVNDHWLREQDSVIEEMRGKELWLSGDGRCDSPGYSAKYGTYTMIDQHTNKVIDFHVVQVSEVGSSNAMEREGFKRCMTNIANRDGNIKVVATDRHIGIAADMKKNYPDKTHQFDVWHLSKSITKKILEKSKKKDCGDLLHWVKSISNHLYWCAETCEGNKELLREKWISVLYHVADIHSWDAAELYHQCPHPPIPPDVARTKRWLERGSPPHDALREVIFNPKLLKDVQQLNLCCHTGSIEVYHNVQTKYAPKRQHFSYKGMVARTQLAALDHNANTGREQAEASKGENEGELRYRVVFPKRTKDWIAKPVMEKTTRDHIRPILDSIIRRKEQQRADRSAGIDTAHIAKNIASTPRPPRADVIAKLTTRFN